MKINALLCGLLCSIPLAASSPEERLYDAAIERICPEHFVYNWRDAVVLKALTDIYRDVPAKRYEIGSRILDVMEYVAPKAYGKHPNAIAPACGFAFLEEIGEADAAVSEAAERVYGQYQDMLRTVDGACSHRAATMELWDDSLYMLEIFLLGMYRAGKGEEYLNECVSQVLSHASRLEDPKSGLWYHGWAESIWPLQDELSIYGWNSNPLHRSNEFWGRGNGWIAMTYADLLEALPEEHPARKTILEQYLAMVKTLLRKQDRKTGLWYQLPDIPKAKGNFLESSCTAMFGYAIAKGVNIGVLDSKCLSSARKAYAGLCEYCIETDTDGRATLGMVCEGTCIGDRDYYLGRKTSLNETYATGAFLMLANQLNKIQ